LTREARPSTAPGTARTPLPRRSATSPAALCRRVARAHADIVAARGATPAVADLYDRRAVASLLWRVLEDDSARGYYVIGDGTNPAVAELTEAAAVAVGAPGAVSGSEGEARARLGDYFAEVLLLDQGTDAAKARADLGWRPVHPSLSGELRHGSYRK
jgi:nucleoside-diphosphate-sugar epimerase